MRRAPVVVVAVGVCLAASACGAANDHGSSSRSSSSSSTSSTAPGAPQATAAPSAVPGSTSTTAASHSPGAGSSGNPGPSSAGGGSGTGPRPAAAGTYRYSQSGSTTVGSTSQSVPAQGTVVVEAASLQGTGRWSQLWHTYHDQSQQPSDATFLIGPSGVALASEVLRQSFGGQTVTYTCTFATPLEIVDWPPTVGYRFSGKADCSGSGSFTADASGDISGTKSADVGGTNLDTYVIETTLTTSGQVTSTTTQTDWFDPAHMVNVHESSSGHGSYGPFSFQSQFTSDLLSLQPG